MRRTNSKETERDWAYSDGFLPHAKRIIGEQLMVAAPMEIDTKEASDLIYLVSGRGDVAFRVRRPQYMQKFPFDITFRAQRAGFDETELDKLFDGHARWMLYGFGSEDGQTLARWYLLDLNAWRAAMLRGVVKRDRNITNNGDGTGFIYFDVRILRAADSRIIQAASIEIPDMGLTTRPQSKREFWLNRLKDDL